MMDAGEARHTRRGVLTASALAMGGALALAPHRSGAASGPMQYGAGNNAGSDQTSLTSTAPGSSKATLRVDNTASYGFAIKAVGTAYGLWAEAGTYAGLVGRGGNVGVSAQGTYAGVVGSSDDPATGAGVIGTVGSRPGAGARGVGVHGFAEGTLGVLGEGGGGTGVHGVSETMSTGVTALTGVGVRGVGSVNGVLVEGTGTGTALKEVAPTEGKAIEADGAVLVSGDLAVSGAVTGARSLARRDAPNVFKGRNTHQRRVRLPGGITARSAGVVVMPSGVRIFNVTTPPAVLLGRDAAILLPPQSNPGGAAFFARRAGPHRFRIIANRALGRAVRLAWAVFD